MSRRAARCKPKFRSALGARVRALRRLRGLTLRELAGQYGGSYVGLCQIELGKSEPTATTLMFLSDRLGCSIDYLVRWQAMTDTPTDVVPLAVVPRELRNGVRTPSAEYLAVIASDPGRARTLEDRLLDGVTRSPTGCWEWGGCSDRRGYGMTWCVARHRTTRTHRLAYALFCGPIPDRIYVLHHCDNPRCVNPTHLFLGTHSDNMRDAGSKGRLGMQVHPERCRAGKFHAAKTHCPQGHEYTPENTYRKPAGERECKTCRQQKSRIRWGTA